MPAGPLRDVRYIHSCLFREADEIEQLAHQPSPDLAELAERLAFLRRVSHVHTSGEEEFIFPIMEKRSSNIGDVYLHDHREEDALFEEITGLIEAAQRGEHQLLPRIRRQTITLTEHLKLHIAKEEQLAVPFLEEQCSLEEQAKIVQGLVSHIPQEDAPVLFPWVFRLLTPEEGVEMAGTTLPGMPPSVQGLVGQWVRGAVTPEKWSYLSQNVPQWSSLPA